MPSWRSSTAPAHDFAAFRLASADGGSFASADGGSFASADGGSLASANSGSLDRRAAVLLVDREAHAAALAAGHQVLAVLGQLGGELLVADAARLAELLLQGDELIVRF